MSHVHATQLPCHFAKTISYVHVQGMYTRGFHT